MYVCSENKKLGNSFFILGNIAILNVNLVGTELIFGS